MQTHSKTPLCSYHYDALDRLVDCKLSGQESARRFYQKDRLATEINSTVQHSIMQHDDHLLAQQQRQTDAMETRLLATDQQRSVLSALNATTPRPITYTPYGHRPLASGLLSLLGFNGEWPDPVTGHYLLGNGYRAFNPVLMRFNSPDSWSPFGKGGMNAYAYCSGEPVNRYDSTGKSWRLVKANLKMISRMNEPLEVQSSRALLKKPSSGNMLNIQRVGEGAYSFEDIYKGKRRLNFEAHGEETAIDQTSRIGVNGELWSAERLWNSVKGKTNFEDFANIRIIACFSGNGGNSSFAAAFSKLSKTPTKGYIGEVPSAPLPEIMEKLFSAVKNQFPLEPYEFVNTFHHQAHYIRKAPIDRNTPHNFKPIKFTP